MIIVSDIGYTYTKFKCKTKEGIFRSTVEDGVIELNNNFVIEYEDKKFTIGERGAYSVDLNKINDLTFKLCLYASILKCIDDDVIEVDLVTGLPIGHFTKQKNSLRESLENKTVFLKYKNKERIIHFSRCIVFPQSAGMFLLEPDKFSGDNLVIDIGGMTVDVSLFEDKKLIKYKSYDLGMLKLYSSIVQNINNHFSINYEVWDAEKVMKNGIYLNDRTVDYSVDSIIKRHVETILRPIKLDFPFKTCKKHFIGGGSIQLQKFLNYEVNKESIYFNVRAFYEVGCEKF
jgi:plasmid segregation protein ParM